MKPLRAEGIATTDLGIFSSVVPTTFDYEAAARRFPGKPFPLRVATT